jgi:hypothetical protein
MQSLGLIKALPLDDGSSGHFERLVAGRTIDTLDDGEAATIACAVAIKGVPIIDERKADQICKERYPDLLVGCTVDIFAHEALSAALGATKLSEAVVNALLQARMRVLPHCLPWVVDLIGPANAGLCLSLPAHVRAKLGRLRKFRCRQCGQGLEIGAAWPHRDCTSVFRRGVPTPIGAASI